MFEYSSFFRRAGLFGIAFLAVHLFVFTSVASAADERLLPPPYQMAGSNHVLLGVVWDEPSIRRALPPGVEPAKGMSGGINIYGVKKGYVIGPYQAAYFWVDIEGFDSPEGIKGRWMLAGVYGPHEKTSAALTEFYGLPVRVGTSRIEATPDGKRATGSLNGRDFISVDVKSAPGPCETAALLVNYVSVSPKSKQIIVNRIPVVGDSCKAEPISAKITAPSDDLFSAYPISKVVWAAELKNGSLSFSYPQPAKQ